MYRQIFNDLIRGIQDGTYPPGGRLPSEKELAELYNVSRITSKKALEMLADRGIILRKPGKGSFVTDSSKQILAGQETEPDTSEAGAAGEDQTESGPPKSRQLVAVILDLFDPFFGNELLRGIEYECRRRGADMLLRITYGSQTEEDAAINDLRNRGARGIILMCSQDEIYNADILKLCVEKYPLVFVDRGLKGLPVPTVTTDNYKASSEMTQRLIDKGHQKICFVSHSSLHTSTVMDRFYGYRDTMVKNRLKTDESLWIMNIDQFLPTEEEAPEQETEHTRSLSEYILQNPDVTAYFAVTFEVANLLIKVLADHKITDKEVVCFDGLIADDLFFPKITHVEQDQFQMGVTAVRHLMHRIQGEEIVGNTLIPYRIIEA